jgi:hypothetical protein
MARTSSTLLQRPGHWASTKLSSSPRYAVVQGSAAPPYHEASKLDWLILASWHGNSCSFRSQILMPSDPAVVNCHACMNWTFSILLFLLLVLLQPKSLTSLPPSLPSTPLHPQTPDRLKTSTAEEAFNKNGLSQRTIRLLKDAFPDLEVRVRVRVRMPFLTWR